MAKFIHIFGLIILCLAFPIKADDDNDTLPPMITVSGTAEVKVQPDEALVSISVQLNNKTVQDLRNQIDTIAADILSYLKDQGVGNNDVQTSYISIQPYYNDTAGDTGDTEPDYYTGDKSMTFLLKNLTKYDAIMSGLYDRGLNSVDGITFQVNDELEPKIEARKKAVENAKKIASAMVEALDARLGNVYSISDNSGGFEPMPVSAPMAANAAADGANAEGSSESSVELSGPSISGGVITFSADVTVSFYILN